MFIDSYGDLREKMIKEKGITSLIQLEYSGYTEATVPICTFILRNTSTGETGEYIRLTEFKGAEKQPQKTREAVMNPNVDYRYTINIKEFVKIPGRPIAYWTTEKVRRVFKKGTLLREIAEPRQGLATADNNRFLRIWSEVNYSRIGFGFKSRELGVESKFKWFPYNKGGEYRKWYGNNNFLVNWENDGFEIRNFMGDNQRLKSRPQNMNYYFKKSITWSFVSSSKFGVRYC